MINKKTQPAEETAKKKELDGDPIEIAIAQFEESLTKQEIKMADYLRLLQIRKEREEFRPTDITVRWVEAWEDEALNVL